MRDPDLLTDSAEPPSRTSVVTASSRLPSTLVSTEVITPSGQTVGETLEPSTGVVTLVSLPSGEQNGPPSTLVSTGTVPPPSSTEETQSAGSPAASTTTGATLEDSGSGFSLGAKIGIGVAVPIIALLLAGALLIWARRRRQRRSAGLADSETRDGNVKAEEYTYIKPELDATETEIVKHDRFQNKPDPVELDGDSRAPEDTNISSLVRLDHTRHNSRLPASTDSIPRAGTISPTAAVVPVEQSVPIEPVTGSPSQTFAAADTPSEPNSEPHLKSQAGVGAATTSDMASLDKLSALLERRAKIAEEQQELERMRRLREEAAAVDEEIRRLKDLSKKPS